MGKSRQRGSTQVSGCVTIVLRSVSLNAGMPLDVTIGGAAMLTDYAIDDCELADRHTAFNYYPRA